ncbi:uncharacterized protein LY79DRAFT_402149 [Colletotrichum navitas]|uniref:Secreted protein n=1 Tax=Colletotrichum navitas TaxID=681940 RepID=A0AAD8PPK9_9PEZI|nr:uncharacterized protein LY79DRAFT_402149 [Colletotrichum navitas]KAK1573618.1 hypothetical protein LY79DRAFT_402149 [Colletotrichum navitas]
MQQGSLSRFFFIFLSFFLTLPLSPAMLSMRCIYPRAKVGILTESYSTINSHVRALRTTLVCHTDGLIPIQDILSMGRRKRIFKAEQSRALIH